MRRNFLLLGTSCLGSYFVNPSYIFNKYSFQNFKNVRSLLKTPNSCLTQLVAMHTDFTESEILQTQFFYDAQKISCSIDIPDKLLQRVFSQRIHQGHLTYLHINSSNNFWSYQENRKCFASHLKDSTFSERSKIVYPKMTISYAADNFLHQRFAQKILKKLNDTGVYCNENPISPREFSNSWRNLEFPILDWHVAGLEPQLLAQLMFDEHSNWSLHNAKQLLADSAVDHPADLYHLAIQIC